MKKLLLTIIILITFTNSYAIDGWIGYQTPVNLKINRIQFINNLTGWAVCDSGKILKSTDGGVSWVLQNSGTNYKLHSISFIDGNTGWCAGGSRNLFALNNYYLYGTTNGGATWDSLFYGGADHSYLNTIHLLSASGGFLLGDGGSGSGTLGFFHKTTNFGTTWNSVLTQTHIYSDIAFKNNNTGWLLTDYVDDTGGDTATILKTTNAGVTWERIYLRNELNLYSVKYLGDDNIIICGQSYIIGNQGRFILRSTNGGQTWDSSLMSFPGPLSPFFVNFNKGWTSGSDGIHRTTDGGLTYEQQFNSPASAVIFIDSLNGWASGSNGIIYRTTTGGVTGIVPVSNHTPERFLVYQNYPNPFNPATVIKFDVPKSGNVKLTVYDNMGRLIETLVRSELSPGTYEINWDGSKYSSGLYFYRLEAGDLTQTKKMLLIK